MTAPARRLPLKFGLFHGPHHATNLDPTYAFERDLLLMQHIDRLGFDEAWIGEHHSGGFEIIAAPEVFIAAAAERTRHIRLGTGVKSLPYHHPFIVAETMAQLDHMTRGRVMFGAGPGALPTDAQMFGLTPSDLRPRMDESLDCVVALLRGETVTKKTNWFELKEARLGFGCYTKPMMELAVTSIRSPAGVQAAGRHGAGVLVLGGIDDDSLAHHASNWRIYEETCAKHGHQADRGKWKFTLMIHAAETREQAKKDLQYGLDKYIGYSNDIIPASNPIPRGLPDPVAWIIENRRAIVGTPDDVVAGIERVREKVGDFGGVLVFQHDWANWPATLRSLELIAEEVRPRINNTNWLRQDSYDRNAP
ncbi:MAG: LLM class flavin-dependent oxidoreductase, partial [Burkholderiales bacterium]